MSKTENKKVIIKPYNIKELRNLYGTSWSVLNRWLGPLKPELGKQVGRLYNINQVKLIFERLGVPGQEMDI